MIEDYDIRGNNFLLGFLTGVFSYDGVEIETLQGKASEIKPDTLTYSVGSDDNGDFFKKYSGKDTAAQDKVRAALEMKTTTP